MIRGRVAMLTLVEWSEKEEARMIRYLLNGNNNAEKCGPILSHLTPINWNIPRFALAAVECSVFSLPRIPASAVLALGTGYYPGAKNSSRQNQWNGTRPLNNENDARTGSGLKLSASSPEKVATCFPAVAMTARLAVRRRTQLLCSHLDQDSLPGRNP
jgi:hypothetical protein